MSWLDATFGVLFDEGEELEILGGINFVGFTITADAENSRHNIAVDPATLGFAASDIDNDSADVSGTKVSDALDALYALIQSVDGSDVPNNRTITAGAGLTGGGDLSADRTITVAAADSTITVNADSIQVGTIGNSNLSDNTVALARLANATAQYDFVMRTSSGAGAWQRGARADLVLAIDAQHVATSFGAPFFKVGASGGTYPTSGAVRHAFVNNAGGGVTLNRGIKEDGSTEASLTKWNADGTNWYTIGASPGGVNAIATILLRCATSVVVEVGGGTIGTWAATGLALNTRALSGVTTLNGASVGAPTQGTAITTTATIDVSAGAKYNVSSAGGAYTITLGTGGSLKDGETVTLRTTAALANAITVANGGTGGGNLGPDSGTIAAGMHAEYYYYYDGTATAWKYGGRQRTQ